MLLAFIPGVKPTVDFYQLFPCGLIFIEDSSLPTVSFVVMLDCCVNKFCFGVHF